MKQREGNPVDMSPLTRWLRCALRPCRHRVLGGRIFLCYRHKDSELATIFVQKILEDRFGRGSVFRDIEIPPGEAYRDAIRKQLASCFAVLVMIGPDWLTTRDERGRRRIQDPHDMVRKEVELALESDARIRVIPVLVDGAQMPRSGDLPDSMARLSYRIACELAPRQFERDTTGVLIPRLETPRQSRFGRWADIRGSISADLERRVPVWALVAHALWRPFWSNTLIPAGLLVAGLTLRGTTWLLPFALLIYIALATITLFDLDQARCVRECMKEPVRAGPRPSPGAEAAP
jgi:TIR domain